MASSSRPLLRAAAALVLFGFTLLPAACGGAVDLVFVGSSSGGSGGQDGPPGGQGGQGGQGGEGGAADGGTGTGGGSGGTILAGCGNEQVDDGEDCDEGRVDTADCDEDCTEVSCGDGYANLEADEECDDGGEDTADCNANCTDAVCGDFYRNAAAGEECDEGTDSPGCDTDCTFARCGDGVVHLPTGEQCDDGNDVAGDGCTPSCQCEVLIIGDGLSEGDAVNLLQKAGFNVVLAPVLEYAFDGTNPVPDGFCGIIQFDAVYDQTMPPAGQAALADYVEQGGDFMSTGYTAVEGALYGDLSAMSDLLLLDFVSSDAFTYGVTTDGSTHPITSGLPATFLPSGYSEAGTCKGDSVPLLADTTYGYATLCLDEDVGEGRVISLGSTFGYFDYHPLLGYGMETLFLNIANWMCGTNHQLPNMTPGSTDVISRGGYQAYCQSWNGNTCLEPYIAMSEADITQPVPHCIDSITSLRPMWWGDISAQAKTWCWIATGSPVYDTSATGQGTNGADTGGWMYGGALGYDTPICVDQDGRHWSDVTVPVVGPQSWSFDDFGYIRQGVFTNIGCIW